MSEQVDHARVASRDKQHPLRVLITNTRLEITSGTETVVRDLALGLAAAGHLPMVYTPRIGEFGRTVEMAGVPVVSDLSLLPAEPDIIHGHHHVETLHAMVHFPRVPAIFVCHDRLSPTDVAVPFPRVARYVAVDLNCRERLALDYGIPEHLIQVIYNWVDVKRFAKRPALPPSPRRALVFSNYAGKNTHLEPVLAACATLELPVDVVGEGVGNPCAEPERILGNYDLVFGKARCALEAMAVGAAVVLCDTRGLGGMVTASRVADFRPWNFGMRLLQQPIEPERIIAEVNKYDAADAMAVSSFVRKEANFDVALETYLGLYQQVLADRQSNSSSLAEEVRDYAHSMVLWVSRLEAQLTLARTSQRMGGQILEGPPISQADTAPIDSSTPLFPCTNDLGKGSYNFDQVHTFRPYQGSPITIAKSKSPCLALAGWAFDPMSGEVSPRILFEIDGKRYAMDHMQSRPDVARYFNLPRIEHSGFSCRVPLRGISTGSHPGRLLFANSDWSGYYSSDPILIEIEE